MIASHDTYTFEKPKNFLMYLIRSFWKCQKKNIQEQYEAGVRIFDVRVHSEKDHWRVAHGITKFQTTFNTIEDIYVWFKENCPKSIIRIYLEDSKPSDEILKRFLTQAEESFNAHKNITWEIGTHHPWKTYFRYRKFTIVEYYCHLFRWDPDLSFWHNITHLDWSSWSIKYFAKKHNPEITQEMIDDTKTMHIMDYVGVYPKK